MVSSPHRSYHNFSTRTFDDIHINRIKQEFAQICINYDIQLIVELTSNLIKNKIVTHSLSGFACYVKKHVLLNYQNLRSVPNCYICQHIHLLHLPICYSFILYKCNFA